MRRKRMADYHIWLVQMLHKDILTKEDVGQILDSQLNLPEKEMDVDLIEECMQFLYPEYKRGGVDAKAQEFVMKLVEQDANQNKNISGHMHSRLRPAMLLLLILAGVMLLGMAIAYALGYPIWNYAFHWGDEQVRIEIDVQSPMNTSESILPQQYQGVGKGDAFDEKLKELQFDLTLPRLPDRYSLSNVDSSTGGMITNLLGFYKAGETELHISIQKVTDANVMGSLAVEKESGYEVMTISGTSYYLFMNIDYVEVVWVSPPYIVQIGGNLDRQELVNLFNTMDGGENR